MRTLKATGVYPNATGLTEVAMGVTEDICTFKVPLNYVLAGGYYDENNEEHTIQGLNSAPRLLRKHWQPEASLLAIIWLSLQ